MNNNKVDNIIKSLIPMPAELLREFNIHLFMAQSVLGPTNIPS